MTDEIERLRRECEMRRLDHLEACKKIDRLNAENRKLVETCKAVLKDGALDPHGYGDNRELISALRAMIQTDPQEGSPPSFGSPPTPSEDAAARKDAGTGGAPSCDSAELDEIRRTLANEVGPFWPWKVYAEALLRMVDELTRDNRRWEADCQYFVAERDELRAKLAEAEKQFTSHDETSKVTINAWATELASANSEIARLTSLCDSYYHQFRKL